MFYMAPAWVVKLDVATKSATSCFNEQVSFFAHRFSFDSVLKFAFLFMFRKECIHCTAGSCYKIKELP